MRRRIASRAPALLWVRECVKCKRRRRHCPTTTTTNVQVPGVGGHFFHGVRGCHCGNGRGTAYQSIRHGICRVFRVGNPLRARWPAKMQLLATDARTRCRARLHCDVPLVVRLRSVASGARSCTVPRCRDQRGACDQTGKANGGNCLHGNRNHLHGANRGAHGHGAIQGKCP